MYSFVKSAVKHFMVFRGAQTGAEFDFYSVLLVTSEIRVTPV